MSANIHFYYVCKKSGSHIEVRDGDAQSEYDKFEALEQGRKLLVEFTNCIRFNLWNKHISWTIVEGDPTIQQLRVDLAGNEPLLKDQDGVADHLMVSHDGKARNPDQKLSDIPVSKNADLFHVQVGANYRKGYQMDTDDKQKGLQLIQELFTKYDQPNFNISTITQALKEEMEKLHNEDAKAV